MTGLGLEEEARLARNLLKNPILLAAFESVVKRAQEDIASSAPEQSAAREAAYYKIRACQDVRDAVQEYITDLSLKSKRK